MTAPTVLPTALPTAMPNNESMLFIKRLTKSFGERQLFDINNLSLQPGTLYVLTGDNGSGKTTLLRILAGLETADKLEMTFAGTSTTGVYPPEWRQHIIHVHQHPYLFQSNVEANVAYGLIMRKVPTATRDVLVGEAIHWAGLDARRGVPPKRLSGGERQRLALARAKVLEPKLLLVDEPTANLDRHARPQIVLLLQNMVAAQRTVVVACHDREIIDLPGVVRLDLTDGALTTG